MAGELLDMMFYKNALRFKRTSFDDCQWKDAFGFSGILPRDRKSVVKITLV